jgi:hypothetical protein
MLRAGKYLTFTTLISVLFFAPPAKAVDLSNPQFSLSLDGLAQDIFFYPKKNANAVGDFATGGAAFADFRPIRVISFGAGFEYLKFPDESSLSLSTVDLGGRLFPYAMDNGEIYFQGGLGYDVHRDSPFGHYHGYAGIGYRYFLAKGLALDAGAQYDFYSPIKAPSNSIGAKVGLTFLFGRDKWPSPGSDLDPALINHQGEYPPGSYYTWKPGDRLKSISARIFGEEDLYPALVDANPDLFSNIANLRIGMKLRVPKADFSDDELADIRTKALSDKYLRLDEYSARLPYESLKGWHGSKIYVWQEGDDMRSVAGKLYGDEDLYPILVDANQNRLIHPVNLVPGVRLVIPPPPADEWLEDFHEKAHQKDYDIWWKNVSEDNAGKEKN